MLTQDLRYAVRTLLKSPGFTTVAVACLALGIGVNATIFSVVDGVMLNPYPYPDADRIIVAHSSNQRLGITRNSPSFKDFEDFRDGNSTLESMAGFTRRSLTISDGAGEPERFPGLAASASLFEIIGERPVLGRSFRPDDDRLGAPPVILLSDHVWRTRYASDPGVIDRAILVNGQPHTIIGVMAPKFAFPENERLWVPIAPYVENVPRDQRGIMTFAKMKPGVTIDQARADLDALARSLAEAYPDTNEGWGAGARPIYEWLLPDQIKLMMLLMMGAVTLVLLIACANVANLMLARASIRQREIAVRSALGAGRWRIVRQLLTEAVLIGLVSAPLGIGLAWVGIRLLDMSMPADGVPYFIRWSLDHRALAYTIGISMLTGLVFGLAPALQASRGSLQETLKEGGRSGSGGIRKWLRNSLVVAEVALSIVLLIGASLFIRSFLNLQHANLGFDTAPLMTMRIYLPGTQYEAPEPRARRIEDIVQRIEALPGVEAAFASNFVPLGGGGGGGRALVEGRAFEKGLEPFIGLTAVTPRMRQTLDVPLLRGRDFSETEGTTRSALALVNEAMAKQLWPGEDALGRRFRLTGDRNPEWFTVVGIVADFRHFPPQGDAPPSPQGYIPIAYDPTLNAGFTIRTAGDPARITSGLREQVRAADSVLPVFDVRTMEDLKARSFWERRLFGWMFGIFGGIALLLASIGVYGVLSYAVSQRTQEIGVRMALGAGRGDVLRLIVGQGLRLAIVGVVIGLMLTPLVTQFVTSQLYNVTPTDPLSFAGVAVFLTVTAFFASYFPARRAMAVDPLVALRNE
jgi:putative ABC transport system permease protein